MNSREYEALKKELAEANGWLKHFKQSLPEQHKALIARAEAAEQCVDVLALALTETDHVWTPEERALYEAVCPVCNGTGWNHGVQCKPSKTHPTGWKSAKCDCVKGDK